MKRVTRAASLRKEIRAARATGERIGFVPTMGSLHQGHLALLRRARGENDCVVASLFVNPLQFGPGEDYASYPRDFRRDRALLRREEVDLVYEPEVDQLYPEGFATTVHVGRLDQRLCGSHRPGHFDGVATVVLKLLHAAEPDRLYLGQKDYQQAVILKRMVRDLDSGCRVTVCPTVREPDGLAMSSRNIYLSVEDRAFAPELYRSLRKVAGQVSSGSVRTAAEARRRFAARHRKSPGQLEYLEVLSAGDLDPVRPLEGRLVVAFAYQLGRTRLIDNILVRVGGKGG